MQFDKGSQEKESKAQEKVWVQHYNGEKKWIPGIIKKTGQVSYQVKVEHDHLWKRHTLEVRVTDIKNKE